MGNRARSGGRRRASGGAGGSESKRLRWVADGEEEEEAGAEEGEEGEEEEDADAAEGKMEEEEAYGEDLCFVCKDGGDLRVCDYRLVLPPAVLCYCYPLCLVSRWFSVACSSNNCSNRAATKLIILLVWGKMLTSSIRMKNSFVVSI
ncbi:hypothetical protein HU200_008085 [Digitaria exilis]|uniref:Uncharacterized protein n=1 Tax=Digitaria exilis TaxID=1010633 RepID=A0A835FKV9_9POAL|nr:hypothetical protein HU200_008085 [Digitaria exilis]